MLTFYELFQISRDKTKMLSLIFKPVMLGKIVPCFLISITKVLQLIFLHGQIDFSFYMRIP